MKNVVTVAACLGLLCAAGASAENKPDCAWSETALPSPAEAPRRSRVVVVSTDPAAGQAVHPRTTIAIDLEYQIVDFQPGSYELVVHFAELAAQSSKIVHDGADKRILSMPQGRVRLCAPIAALYREDDVRWPLQMQVSLQKRTGPRSSLLVADSRRVAFPSTELSARALQRQKEAFTEDYYLALDSIFAFHEERLAEYRACLARLPETAESLEAPYRAWSDRHAALFTQIDTLKLEAFTEMVRGTGETASARMDSLRKEFTDHIERQPDVSLRQRCANLLIVFAGDPREFVGRYVSIVNEQVAARPPAGERRK